MQRRKIEIINKIRKRDFRMKTITSRVSSQQRSSQKGGDTGRKERMNSRVFTVCFTKGATLMVEIRDYRGGDYEHDKHIEKCAARWVSKEKDF